MTTKILRARMHNNISTMDERILQSRRRKGRINNKDSTTLMRFLSVVGNIESRPVRVDRRFEENDITLLQSISWTIQV